MLVKTICNQFCKAKIDYWISFESDIYGEQYAATIIKNIDEATIFLVLISENSNRSIHVINEINSAIIREKPIIPIISGNVELSPSLEYYLSSIHWLQYENNDKFFSQLLKRLYDIEGKDISKGRLT